MDSCIVISGHDEILLGGSQKECEDYARKLWDKNKGSHLPSKRVYVYKLVTEYSNKEG